MVPTQAQLQEIYEANLRQREEGAEGASGLASTRDLQFLEDERIALMLQNEEFMAELRCVPKQISTAFYNFELLFWLFSWEEEADIKLKEMDSSAD